jgi:hypothetical protein
MGSKLFLKYKINGVIIYGQGKILRL